MTGEHGGTPSGRGRILHRELMASNGFISARDLRDRLMQEGSPVGLATVYRHLRTLLASGSAEAVRTTHGELFRALTAEAQPHVHLVCDTCGWADEVDASAVDVASSVTRLLAAIDTRGLASSRPALEVHGVCVECR